MFLKIACCGIKRSYSVQKIVLKYLKSCSVYCSYPYRCVCFKTSPTKDFSDELKGTTLNDKNSVNDTKRKCMNHLRLSEDVQNYFLSRPWGGSIVNQFPSNMFRINRHTPEHIYLADKDVADTIAATLQKHVVQKNSCVLDVNPGIGLLAKSLNDVGVPLLHLYEPSTTFFNHLQTMKTQAGIFHEDFLALWKMAYKDKFDNGTRVKDILSRYPQTNWEDDPTLKIIGINPTAHFIKHLILSLTTQNGIMMHCRPELFIIMPPSLYANFSASKADGYFLYRGLSIIFQTFFDYELLIKLPRKAFVPWCTSPTKRRFKFEDSNGDTLYLVRIVPKKDLYEKFSPPERLRHYWFFVRHHFRTRSKKLISEMERWIPGCGVRLILEGYNVFTELGELTPEEVYHVFILFTSWPEFHDSSFLTSIETTEVKMEEATGVEYQTKLSSDESSNDLEESSDIHEENEGSRLPS